MYGRHGSSGSSAVDELGIPVLDWYTLAKANLGGASGCRGVPVESY